MYAETENRYNKVLNIFSKGVLGLTIATYGPPVLPPISHAILGYPEPGQWNLPQGFRYIYFGLSNIVFVLCFCVKSKKFGVFHILVCSAPIPGNIYVAFYIDWFAQSLGGAAYMLAIFIVDMYFIGMCWYIHSMVDDLKVALVGLDEQIRAKSTKSPVEMEDYGALAGEIVFHIDVIE